nr:MAG TPA: hypothetical protein [Inoviridae sp.]
MSSLCSLFIHHLPHRHFYNRIFYVFYFLSLKHIFTVCFSAWHYDC